MLEPFLGWRLGSYMSEPPQSPQMPTSHLSRDLPITQALRPWRMESLALGVASRGIWL